MAPPSRRASDDAERLGAGERDATNAVEAGAKVNWNWANELFFSGEGHATAAAAVAADEDAHGGPAKRESEAPAHSDTPSGRTGSAVLRWVADEAAAAAEGAHSYGHGWFTVAAGPVERWDTEWLGSRDGRTNNGLSASAGEPHTASVQPPGAHLRVLPPRPVSPTGSSSVASGQSVEANSTPRRTSNTSSSGGGASGKNDAASRSGAAPTEVKERALERRRELKRQARRRESAALESLERTYQECRDRVLRARGHRNITPTAVNALPETRALQELSRRHQPTHQCGDRTSGLGAEEMRIRRNMQKRESKKRIQRHRMERAALLEGFIASFRAELLERGALPPSGRASSGDGSGAAEEGSAGVRPNKRERLTGRAAMGEAEEDERFGSSDLADGDVLDTIVTRAAATATATPSVDGGNMLAWLEPDLRGLLSSRRSPTPIAESLQAEQIKFDVLTDLCAEAPARSSWDLGLLSASGMSAVRAASAPAARALVALRVFRSSFTMERAAQVLGLSPERFEQYTRELVNGGLLLSTRKDTVGGGDPLFMIPEYVRRIPVEAIVGHTVDSYSERGDAAAGARDRGDTSRQARRLLRRIVAGVQHNFVQDMRARLAELERLGHTDRPEVWYQVHMEFERLRDDFFYAIELAGREYGAVGMCDVLSSIAYAVRYMVCAEDRVRLLKQVFEYFHPIFERQRQCRRDADRAPGAAAPPAEKSAQRNGGQSPSQQLERMRCLYNGFLEGEVVDDDDDELTSPMQRLQLSEADEEEFGVVTGLCLGRAHVDSLSYTDAERVLLALLELCEQRLSQLPCDRPDALLHLRQGRIEQLLDDCGTRPPLADMSRSVMKSMAVRASIHPTILVGVLENLAKVYVNLGRHERACRLLSRTLHIRHELRQQRTVPYAITLVTYGEALIGNGEPDRARHALHEAISIMETERVRSVQRPTMASHAEALYLLAVIGRQEPQRHGEAMKLLEAANRILQARHRDAFFYTSHRTVPMLQAMLFKLMAEIHLAHGERERAQTVLTNVLAELTHQQNYERRSGRDGGSQQQNANAVQEVMAAMLALGRREEGERDALLSTMESFWADVDAHQQHQTEGASVAGGDDPE
ncbi:hypothetical protein CDCA_CDCA04G1333 [Cyanidium caldarium]|uniref:Uncharacterized protein n=1 Tax=Cyanidium caldarium TaxID=2771 RepID=A0AAV9ITY1_CYACA|nr:hypothetical protein CDCA_CDCA04G1333 [Cyanidium caldarium]